MMLNMLTYRSSPRGLCNGTPLYTCEQDRLSVNPTSAPTILISSITLVLLMNVYQKKYNNASLLLDNSRK